MTENILIIRQARVFLSEGVTIPRKLSLKMCVNREIFKFPDMRWDNECSRWQVKEEIVLPWESEQPIQFQIYKQLTEGKTEVIGEGLISLGILSRRPNQEIKIPITYDQVVVGWLYCQILMDDEVNRQSNNTFLQVHKINLAFLEESDNQIKLQIIQNDRLAYQRLFSLPRRSKTLMPNLKISVKLSDIIFVKIIHPEFQTQHISFLIDHIKRGKSAIQTWKIRNMHNKRCADLSMQYFLDNIYFENERKVFPQQAALPCEIKSNFSSIKSKNKKQEDKTASVLVKSANIQNSDRILQFNTSLNRTGQEYHKKYDFKSSMVKHQSNQHDCNTPSSVHKNPKLTFYFQNVQQ